MHLEGASAKWEGAQGHPLRGGELLVPDHVCGDQASVEDLVAGAGGAVLRLCGARNVRVHPAHRAVGHIELGPPDRPRNRALLRAVGVVIDSTDRVWHPRIHRLPEIDELWRV